MPQLAKDSPRLRILLLEPDPREAEMQRLKLELDEYEVAIAPDETGLRVASEGQLDLILLDLRGPNWDGAAALKSIRSHEPTRLTPVLILTDGDEAALAEQGIELGPLELAMRTGGAGRSAPGGSSEGA